MGLGALHAASTESRPRITSAAEFWDLPEPDKHHPVSISVELTVCFYDPQWHVLFGEEKGVGVFLGTGAGVLPISWGDHVRLSGDVIVADGLDASRLKTVVLGRHALPPPVHPDPSMPSQAPWNNLWASIEGDVVSQQFADGSHLAFQLIAHDRLITGQLQLGPSDTVPILAGQRIRAVGAYVATPDPAGHIQAIALWVPTRTLVERLGATADDTRFQLPRTPIQGVAAAASGVWVHIEGKLQAHELGRSITLRDDTGQLTITSEDPRPFRVGDTLEVVGLRSGQWILSTLRDVSILPHRGSGAGAGSRGHAGGAMDILRLADQIMSLPPGQQNGHPVALSGVVTWSDSDSDVFYLSDASGGIAIRRPAASSYSPPVGTMLSINGVTRSGPFAPEVAARFIARQGGNTAPPVPESATLEEALTGSREARWTEMSGYLRAVEADGPWMRLDLTTSTGQFAGYLRPDAELSKLVGAQVRIVGVCTAETNDRHQLTGVRLWLPNSDSLQVLVPPPAEPFDAPHRTVASLRQFHGRAVTDRVLLHGVVVAAQAGRYFYLQDEDAGLLVLSRDSRPLHPGDWVDAVGLPGLDGSRVVLREALWRAAKAGPAPVPLAIANPAQLEPDADGRLVRLRARVGEVIADGDSTRLVMRSDREVFDARLDHARPAELPTGGSIVELTGAYALQYDEYRRPRGFSLLLRTPADVHLLEAPSWWTATRALVAAAGLAFCLALGVIWLVLLRRKVNEQTEQIRLQLEQSGKLQQELERVARLDSLGVLAGGIAHDFNNLLTVVIASLGLAGGDEGVPEGTRQLIADAERGARRAAEITQQLLTFSKGGDPIRAAVSLPEVVRESAEFAGHGSNVRREYAIEPGLRPANIDRAQIGRVVHNLVLNATQAMDKGGLIRIGLTNVDIAPKEIPTLKPGAYIRLTIADDGPGIPADQLPRIFEPYFSTKTHNHGLGLATVHSIVIKHGGHISVESEPGRGTTFRLWLPAAEASASVARAAETSPASHAVRALFMDDEDSIRRLAAKLFRKLGHEATLVGDGAEAVRAYRKARDSGRPFDVVILDLTVPGGMGGRAAMDELRLIDPDVRAIVSSGYSSDPVMANHTHYGFRAVVTKPYDAAALGQAIDRVVRRAPGARNGAKPELVARA